MDWRRNESPVPTRSSLGTQKLGGFSGKAEDNSAITAGKSDRCQPLPPVWLPFTQAFLPRSRRPVPIGGTNTLNTHEKLGQESKRFPFRNGTKSLRSPSSASCSGANSSTRPQRRIPTLTECTGTRFASKSPGIAGQTRWQSGRMAAPDSRG